MVENRAPLTDEHTSANISTMQELNLKITHKPVKEYFAKLQEFSKQQITHEGAVSAPFGSLLDHCAKQINATFSQQYPMTSAAGNRIVIDGAVTKLGLPLAYWEAKDIHDDLPQAVQQKRQAGYPFDNILFQTPERGILIQNGQIALDTDLTDKNKLVETLKRLFSYTTPVHEDWEQAVTDFKTHVPDLAAEMKQIIEERYEADADFKTAFNGFYETCKAAINPNLSQNAVEEMLVQHVLTERIFRTVFDHSDFSRRNIIASEIEKVIDILTRNDISRDAFLSPLNPFYNAIENAARNCHDFSQKQHLLNTFYEQFFQGFSEDVADTHGIVYTPQPIVDFMVNSVSHILKTEFGRSLSDEGVHIIDPFVGTGNFIVRLMHEISGAALQHKYQHELHCNEVMLLPYYIASLNIEQEYYHRTQRYLPFEGIVLADTFELLEDKQMQLFTEKNTERVERQKDADMFVVIGNPPYNMTQVNDMDNNRNRPYKTMDQLITDTYVADSTATLKTALYDPYVKAIKWASNRIGEEGIVAFVTNNGFLDGIACDGMRKHLAQDFDTVYILDLGGNARKGLKVSDANVFGIRVGVSINIFVKTKQNPSENARIFYYRTDDVWNKNKTFDFMNDSKHVGNIEWQQIQPNKKHTWLTEGLHDEFETFTPMGTKEAKAQTGVAANVVFKTYCRGVATNRDKWVYHFNKAILSDNIQRMINTYNSEMDRWKRRENLQIDVKNFVLYDETKIKWDRELRQHMQRGRSAEFTEDKLRPSLYRPYTKSNLFFDRVLNNCVYLFPTIFPLPDSENQVICMTDKGSERPFTCIITDCIPNLVVAGGFGCPSQCFPFYTYDEDGSNRKENITDWALNAFRAHYNDDTISKWDIFHYTYALLHHPAYREKYQANLKRDLPHIPYAPDFKAFAKAGAELADLHVNYETMPQYQHYTLLENRDVPLTWRVEKMKLSKDKTKLIYNDYFTIDGIPPRVFEYRLGTRSALEWVIDQYQVKTDKRSGIVNDPNRPDDKRYIVELILRVITVSLGTVKIVEALPDIV